MPLIAHLCVNDGAGFIDFCKRAFGAVETMRMPDPNSSRIMHAHLKFGDSDLMLADEFPEFGGKCKSAQTLGGVTAVLNVGVEDADAAFEQAVAAGAKVTMPLADQFWGDRYGQVEDPYGNVWAISATKEKLTPEEMMQRAAQAMG